MATRRAARKAVARTDARAPARAAARPGPGATENPRHLAPAAGGAGGQRDPGPPPRAPSRARSGGSPRPRAQRDFRDEVVIERTGRSRADWYAILDAFDTSAHGHKAAAAHLMDVHGAPPWWAQMITVEYERVRGIRSFGERSDGFTCTVQRALGVPATRAWTAFEDPAEVSCWTASGHRHRFRERSRWQDSLGGRGRFERIVPGRYVRFTWDHPTRAPRSTVEVEVLARGDARSTIRLKHHGIRSAEECEDLRTHWSWALDSLKSFVETGAPIELAAWIAAR